MINLADENKVYIYTLLVSAKVCKNILFYILRGEGEGEVRVNLATVTMISFQLRDFSDAFGVVPAQNDSKIINKVNSFNGRKEMK